MMTSVDITGWEILIVDDEPDNLTFLEVLLNFFDAHVVTARSGEQALQLLDSHVYRLALLDLQMPKVSGWELVKEVRKHENPAIRNTPLIAVTALAMPGDRERVLASGFDGYITKPVEVPTFMQTISVTLDALASQRITVETKTDVATFLIPTIDPQQAEPVAVTPEQDVPLPVAAVLNETLVPTASSQSDLSILSANDRANFRKAT